MEVRIGIKQVSREVVIQSAQTTDEIQEIVTQALAGDTPLTLSDEKGRRVVVPREAVGFVEIGNEEGGQVGFGSY